MPRAAGDLFFVVQAARGSAGILFEVLDEGDNEGALREKSAGRPGDDGGRLLGERKLEIQYGGERGGVELLQSFGDAFGLRAGKASALEFF